MITRCYQRNLIQFNRGLKTTLRTSPSPVAATSVRTLATTYARSSSSRSVNDGPLKCTWHLGTKEKSPHPVIKPVHRFKILDNITEHIGHTPLVRLNRIGKNDGLKCEIVAKCEFFNAGGSVKDRIGKRMVEDAEMSGRLKKGDTIIEPTSGNTGIGLALAAAVKGYRVIITLPEKMSQEKVDVLKALGAEIIRTPTEAAWDSPESHIGVAARLNQEIPNSHILDQYINPSNPLAHYDGTAEEIIEQTDGKLDMIVVSAGTGGTITGIARKLKEKIPGIKVIGIDPVGSILAQPESLNNQMVDSYHVEGIGYDFIPTVLDRDNNLIDKWYKSSDPESFVMSRRLIREEGILCGGSSGTAVHYALQAARDFGMKEGNRVCVVLPDSVRNYMTKFLNDDWMRMNGFEVNGGDNDMDHHWWTHHRVANLELQNPQTVPNTSTVHDAIDIMKTTHFSQLPVVSKLGKIEGIISEGNLASLLSSGRISLEDPVSKAAYKQFRSVTAETKLRNVSAMFNTEPFVIVVSTDNKVVGVISRIDLLSYIQNAQK